MMPRRVTIPGNLAEALVWSDSAREKEKATGLILVELHPQLEAVICEW